MADPQDSPRYSLLVDENGYVSNSWYSWFLTEVYKPRLMGLTTTVPLAKLTGGGSNGSLTFVNGILTAKVDPT